MPNGDRSDTPQRMTWRKKPVAIDAMQYDGTNSEAVIHAFGLQHGRDYKFTPTGGLLLVTLESNEHLVSVGDFVIRGVKGEHYACKPDIFAATYERADTPSETRSIPEGWKLVPIAPTEAMLDRAEQACFADVKRREAFKHLKAQWREMLAAAPEAPK